MTLTRSAPTELKVDAGRVLAFLDAVEASGMELHSLMILRHGSVVAEGWWAPYRRDDVQLLYSLSKTFTAMAIGVAVGEGLFSTEDLVADLLPRFVPAQLPDHLRQLRVRHLLSMASGHREETLERLGEMGPDPVRSFLSLVPEEPPGTIFAYNQGNPLTLSQIITTVTGQRIADYLRPRLFDPLGIEHAEWLTTSAGIDQGYSGLHVTTEAVAKLGQLILQNGRWEDVQLVPSGYVRECRRPQIDSAGHFTGPDWQEGYGYLMWICRYGAQRGDGAFGQYSIVLPDADAVVACTSRVSDMQAELDLIWEHLLPAFGDSSPSREDDRALAERLKRLSITPVAAGAPGPGRPVELSPTRMDEPFDDLIERARIEPRPGGTRLVLTVAGEEHAFDLPNGQWSDGVLPGLSRQFPEVSVSGGWVAEDEYHADVIWRCAPHRLELRARLGSRPTLTGELLGTLLFPI
ncbi:MAG: beta-lactamase family protein [bacterium]|jgi:CubicO group peptidase (beta-lactamase class C family)|nr:beta-lactamase family protein [bacterium]